MKKTIAALFAVASAAVFAGMNDLMISFSTPGTDMYADGTPVLDGECYSLVYTWEDGSQEVVLSYAGAKDGKCPLVIFKIKEDEAVKYTGGSWGVFLVDTRVFEEGKAPVVAGIDQTTGLPKNVNAKASVTDPIVVSGSVGTTANASAGVAAGAYDLSGIPQPKVTGIKVVGAKVFVTVTDTVPFVGYTLQCGDDVMNFAVPEDSKPSNGSTGGEITLATAKKDGAQFFKVSTVK